jgi:hypothetical protein
VKDNPIAPKLKQISILPEWMILFVQYLEQQTTDQLARVAFAAGIDPQLLMSALKKQFADSTRFLLASDGILMQGPQVRVKLVKSNHEDSNTLVDQTSAEIKDEARRKKQREAYHAKVSAAKKVTKMAARKTAK